MSWIRELGAAAPVGTSCSCQVLPLSIDPQTAPFQAPGASPHCAVPLEVKPSAVEAQTVVVVAEPAVAGSIRIREIDWPRNGPPGSDPNCFQVTPPSVERRTPAP